MTEPLGLDRFRALADAYGGVVARWPESCRDEAVRLGRMPEGEAILARASVLDMTLDEWTVAAPSTTLSAHIEARGSIAVVSMRSRLRWWWSGMGIAATLAGAVAGTAAVAMVAPADVVASSTSFGDIAGTDG
ncbi:hypothetical protein [Sphingomonas sp. 1P08PE]|uniref:hypothetical protein n=1 Tax=Sphingomonas sp. 1P08PE TaxID=554122 RepID=UPI0039A2D9B2